MFLLFVVVLMCFQLFLYFSFWQVSINVITVVYVVKKIKSLDMDSLVKPGGAGSSAGASSVESGYVAALGVPTSTVSVAVPVTNVVVIPAGGDITAIHDVPATYEPPIISTDVL